MKYIKPVLLILYCYFLLKLTILGRTVKEESVFQGLFWEVQNGMWKDIWLNILLFIPVGLLIGGWKGFISGLVLSCAIEAVQYFWQLGLCEIDDVVNNTIGTGIGIFIWSRVNVMGLKKWEDLPAFMQIPEVRPYWNALNKKRGQLVLKRVFDFIVALILFVLLAIPIVIISLMIMKEDSGPVLYRQERVTTYGKHFRIHKFRTMVVNADKMGTAVTVGSDSRITNIGAKLRKLRLDELPQILDVITGDMSFVGTRPESVKYVDRYKPEFNATLLMPAGITSEASIRYKNEDKLLNAADDVDEVYMNQVLPAKMKWNLESINRFCFLREILTMFRTVAAVLGKDYE